MNPLYSQMNNMLIQRLNQFIQNFTGNPQTQIQQLLNSGKISQEQYNQAFQKAQELQRMLKG